MIWLLLCLKYMYMSRLILNKKKTKSEYFEHTHQLHLLPLFYIFIFLKTRIELSLCFYNVKNNHVEISKSTQEGQPGGKKQVKLWEVEFLKTIKIPHSSTTISSMALRNFSSLILNYLTSQKCQTSALHPAINKIIHFIQQTFLAHY